MSEQAFLALCLFLMAAIGYAIGYVHGWGRGSGRREKLIGEFAVLAGKAEYYTDENGEKKWRWK